MHKLNFNKFILRKKSNFEKKVAMDFVDSYATKDQQYYNHVRHDVVSLLPAEKNLHILEVGAGSGSTLMYLKNEKIAEKVYGVDIMKIANGFQNDRTIDKFFIQDIEENSILDIEENSLDAIIYPDVLEHLYYPQRALENLKKYLKPNGIIITSIPNFRNRNTLIRIYFKGNFKYDERGIFDRTHIRFFCKQDMCEMINNAGFNIKSVIPEYELQYKLHNKRKWTYWKVKFSAGLLEEFYTTQYLIVAENNAKK